MHTHWTGLGHEGCGSHFCLLDNKIKSGGAKAREGEGKGKGKGWLCIARDEFRSMYV